MINIKEILDENPIVAAPLAGISTEAYRALCLNYGCGLVYTEMTSSEAIHYHNIKTLEMTRIANDNHPIALQLFGSKPLIMQEAAAFIDKTDADIIDINMGCPAPKVVKTGAGSALMRDPKKAFEIVRRMKEVTVKPITVKIRLGYSENEKNYLSFAKGLEEAGASAIAIHGRTRSQMYEGVANWDAIKEVKDALNIPVIGNGDIRSIEDFFRRKEESGVDGIMIGRGLVGNPFLIKEIDNALKGKEDINVTVEERFNACLFHSSRLCKEIGEVPAMRQMRGIAVSYLKGLPQASIFKARCSSLNTLKELEDLLFEYQNMLQDSENSCK